MTFLLGAWLALLPSLVLAESYGQTPPPESADLGQCYDWTLQQAESLHMQEEQVYQLEQQYKQVLAAALPNANFFASEKWQDTSGNTAGSSSPFFASPQPSVGFSLAQPLFSGLREYAAMKSFKHQGQAAELNLRHAHALLYQNVASAFYLAVNLETQLSNTRLAVDLSSTRLKELRRFEELGKSRHSEVTLLESQEAGLESSVETIRGQVDAARAVLSFLTGKDMALAKLVDRLDRVRDFGSEEEALGRASGRSDVRALRKTVESQEDQVRLAKGAFFPTVSFLGNYYAKRTASLAPINWDATVSGTFPLFQGGGQLAAVRQARSQLSAAQYGFELQLRQARSDIHTAFAALRATVASAEAAERAYLKADETYRAETKEYRLGLVNNLDVLTAMNNLISAKNTFDQIVVQGKLNLLQLKLSGEELP